MNQIGEVSLVSSMSYSDSKKIADIDTDLLRTPIESDAISNNVKNAIIATEDENFNKHKGVVPKAVFRALVSSVLGVGSSSGGSTLTQQLINNRLQEILQHLNVKRQRLSMHYNWNVMLRKMKF